MVVLGGVTVSYERGTPVQVTGKVQSKYDRLVARSVDVTTDLEAQVMSPSPPTGYGYSVGPYGAAYRRDLRTTRTRSWYPYPVSSQLVARTEFR